MNLSKLFKMQAKLDVHTELEHPRKEGEDRLAKKILALQVELGELANEWRGFKFWSNDQEPRTVKRVATDWGEDGTPNEWDVYPHVNPLLEEYVDCLGFILSIGLELGANAFLQGQSDWTYMEEKDIVRLFQNLFVINWDILDDDGHFEYFEGFEYFMTLGRELGFTWEQIEQAYIEKNKVNQERQVTERGESLADSHANGGSIQTSFFRRKVGDQILEEIKSNIEYHRFGSKVVLDESEYNYLIQQAERAEELEEIIADYAYEIGKRKKALNTKNEQNKRYREAIKRALDESGWGDEGYALYKMTGILTKALESDE